MFLTPLTKLHKVLSLFLLIQFISSSMFHRQASQSDLHFSQKKQSSIWFSGGYTKCTTLFICFTGETLVTNHIHTTVLCLKIWLTSWNCLITTVLRAHTPMWPTNKCPFLPGHTTLIKNFIEVCEAKRNLRNALANIPSSN